MKKSRTLLIISLIIILIFLWLISLILKSPYILIISIILGVIFVLIIIHSVIEVLFPKNKFSKKVEKLLDWIINDLHIAP